LVGVLEELLSRPEIHSLSQDQGNAFILLVEGAFKTCRYLQETGFQKLKKSGAFLNSIREDCLRWIPESAGVVFRASTHIDTEMRVRTATGYFRLQFSELSLSSDEDSSSSEEEQ